MPRNTIQAPPVRGLIRFGDALCSSWRSLRLIKEGVGRRLRRLLQREDAGCASCYIGGVGCASC
ncbi:hypothetical protein PS645_00117 [Pseudomonas fluorescens]|uniref:Uncharacterized protein n=1 Tax=Pseudomonas fluorescens TaxID=294 RepID=A0A5E6P922_PSEFL|nr:hypothetical protein PS645_00117 [Pseudomonas fluorescens]